MWDSQFPTIRPASAVCTARFKLFVHTVESIRYRGYNARPTSAIKRASNVTDSVSVLTMYTTPNIGLYDKFGLFHVTDTSCSCLQTNRFSQIWMDPLLVLPFDSANWHTLYVGLLNFSATAVGLCVAVVTAIVSCLHRTVRLVGRLV